MNDGSEAVELRAECFPWSPDESELRPSALGLPTRGPTWRLCDSAPHTSSRRGRRGTGKLTRKPRGNTYREAARVSPRQQRCIAGAAGPLRAWMRRVRLAPARSRSVPADARLAVAALPLDKSSSQAHVRLQVTSEARPLCLLRTRPSRLYGELDSTSLWLSGPRVVSDVCCSLLYHPFKKRESRA